jgi:anti-sigma B factor antagonist
VTCSCTGHGGRGRTVLTASRFKARWAGSRAILTFPPEADIANAGQATEELNVVLAHRPATVIVDLTGTRFCDSSAITALIHARNRATSLGITLRIAGARGSITRVMQVIGADRLLDMYPTLEAALADAPPEN